MEISNAEVVAGLYKKYNMIYGDKGLLQIDTQVAYRKRDGIIEEAHLCNFHCGEEGGYGCPARALSPANKGVKKPPCRQNLLLSLPSICSLQELKSP
jgi:hypothetical protein